MSKKKDNINVNQPIHLSDLINSISMIMVVDDVRKYSHEDIQKMAEEVRQREAEQENKDV